MLWKTTIENSGPNEDLRFVLPYMLNTGLDYFGYDTGEQISLAIKINNRINILKETSVETNPLLIYAPEYTSSSENVSVTEVRFNPNATRVYFRVKGVRNMKIHCSNKTTLTADGIKYPMIGSIAVGKLDDEDVQIFVFIWTFLP